MEYRQAAAAELRRLAELRWEWHTGDSAQDTAVDRGAYLDVCEEFLREGLARGTWAYWVAAEDGEIVANIFVQRIAKVPKPALLHGEWGYLTNVYARPRWRDRGIGSELLRRVREWARDEGLELLIVWPSERSGTLYERAGFSGDNDVLEFQVRTEQRGTTHMALLEVYRDDIAGDRCLRRVID